MKDDSRTRLLLGEKGIEALGNSTVAVFGIGGVGGHAVEALTRAGVGKIIITDFDTVSPSNLNRQIISLEENIGKYKTDVCEERLKSINPDVVIIKHTCRLTPDNIEEVLTGEYRNLHVIDAIDDINAKSALIRFMVENRYSFISSMGAGNRLDPSKIKIDDISKTSHCPLARAIRKRLREHRIFKGVSVVYSTEEPQRTDRSDSGIPVEERAIGSISYMPGIFGLTASGYTIRKIVGQ